MKVENLDLPKKVKKDYIDSGIKELNPPQKKAVEAGLMDQKDLIIASPTASGKTFIAELAIVNQVKNNKGKAIYIVPLKALASEKYQDFKERYQDLNVMMSIGDRDESGEYLENGDIIIVTSEKLDSMLRHNPSWIHEINLVVTDEIHLLTSPNRGPTLEITLTRLRDILEFQFIGLSATISNSNQLAEWIDAELVESNYRPVTLEQGIIHGNEIEFYPENYKPQQQEKQKPDPTSFKTGAQIKHKKTGKEKNKETRKEFIEDKNGRPSLNVLGDTLEKDKQCIIFCNSRKGAEKSSDRCGEVTENDLSRDEKQKLKEYADQIENELGNPTPQCKRLAQNVRKGDAFHHAGLCVSGDSLVMHSDGTFSRMDNLFENRKNSALGLENYRVAENSIEEKFEMGEKPLLKIETRLGKSIKVSKNHQFPLMEEKGIRWRKAKNLTKGDRIATPREINIDVETPNLRELLRDEVRTYRIYDTVNELEKNVDTESLSHNFRDRYSEDRNISLGGFRELCEKNGIKSSEHLEYVMSKAGQKPVRIPEEMDKDIAWMIGAVAGDGHLDGSVSLSGSCEKILDRFKRICREKFEREPTIRDREDGLETVSLNSKAVKDLMVDHFGIPNENKAYNLRMPEIGFPIKQFSSYLRGVYDTDGSVNYRKNSEGSPCIELYSISEEFITEIQTSLLRLGIISHKDKRNTDGRTTKIEDRKINTNGDIHRISIYGTEQIREFKDKIGFTHPKKSLKLEKIINVNPSSGRNQNDVIPEALGPRIRKIRENKGLSLSDLEPDVPATTVSRFENQKNPMKRKTFQKLAERLNENDLIQIAESDIYWDKIEQITEIEPEKLYDLSTSTENFTANGLIAHNTTNQRELVEEAFRKGLLRSVSATPTLAAGINLPAYRVIMRDLKRYTGRGMEYIPVLEYEQMVGRAGRPKYDDHGEAISVAKNPGMTDEILERYILGEAENIQSKLSAEPILRMHTLSLVASKFCTSMDGLLEFYSKTFYAYQYGDIREVESTIEKVVRQLREYGFLEEEDLSATKIGERVSELYIDPDSAHLMINSMEKAENREEVKSISYLFMLSRTTEMQPRPRVRDKEASDIEKAMFDAEKYLLESLPAEWSADYEHFLECMKNSMMLQAWISELDEEKIMNKYNVAPGGIRAKTSNADWLIYGAQELARMKEIDLGKDLEKLRIRLKHGISEELLTLVKYDQIGRVRARKLYDHGIRDRETIRETGFEKMKKLIGDKTARKLKKQVGQENIFDRENIMDYFD